MAGAASPSTQRDPDTADKFQASSSTADAQRRGRPRSRGRGASRGRSGSRSRSTERAHSRGRSASQPCSSSRPRHDSSGRTRSRSRTPTTPKSKKKPTLSWADKAREGRESPRGDDSPRGSPHAKELDELRRANEQLRKENAQVKQEMGRLAAEIRRLASSPSSAQPASAPVAMDTSEAPHRSSAPKRRAVENTEKEETGNLLSEITDAFVNMQATLAKIQEAMTHPEMGLGALSERIRKLEEGDARGNPRPTPSQVAAQRNILAPPTEGAILTAALAAQPSPQPKYGE